MKKYNPAFKKFKNQIPNEIRQDISGWHFSGNQTVFCTENLLRDRSSPLGFRNILIEGGSHSHEGGWGGRISHYSRARRSGNHTKFAIIYVWWGGGGGGSRGPFLESLGNLSGPISVFGDKCFLIEVNFCYLSTVNFKILSLYENIGQAPCL